MSRRSGRRELVGYILFSGGFRSRQWNDNRQICRCRAEGAVFQDVVEEERVVFEGEVESDRLRTDVERALWSIARKTEDLAFYVVDYDAITRKYREFRALLPRVRPFYAVKCNPSPSVLRVLADLGSGFDCASKTEMKLLNDLSIDVSKDIIYANPCKAAEHISYADRNGVRLTTFDNADELYKIARLAPHMDILLRIATDDSETSAIPLSAKFGANMDEVVALIRLADQLHLRLVGVAFHVGSDCKTAEGYRSALQRARIVFDLVANERKENIREGRWKDSPFRILDIGGGFPGAERNVSFSEIADVVNAELDLLFTDDVEVIAEPGRFMVAESHTLAAQIVAKRSRGDRTDYYIGDGVYGSFGDVVMARKKFTPHLLQTPDELSCRNYRRGKVFGPTCDAIDTISSDCYLPEAKIGEWMYFTSMGAYTTSLYTAFNGFELPCSYPLHPTHLTRLDYL